MRALRLVADLVVFANGGRISLGASLIQLMIPYGRFGSMHLPGSSMAATIDLIGGG